MTLQITEPKTAHQMAAIHQIVHGNLYRKGTDPFLFVDVNEHQEEPRLLIVNLNLIPGIKAKVFGEFDLSLGAPIRR